VTKIRDQVEMTLMRAWSKQFRGTFVIWQRNWAAVGNLSTERVDIFFLSDAGSHGRLICERLRAYTWHKLAGNSVA
jgi:hypothetical protein